MRADADVVIVGGGIMGLAIAYHLATRGVTKVTVVEKSYLCSGASGRNGGGVRAQWSSEANVRLMQESIEMCRDFAQKMKINVWFRQGGYLFLARSAQKVQALEQSVKVQNECGLGTSMLTPSEAKKIVPELDATPILAASYNPDDGVVFPWPFVWGYAQAAQRLGVEVIPFCDVIGFETSGSRIDAVTVRPNREIGSSEKREQKIATHKVVNAAGAWSPEVAKMLGIDLPNRPHRHEICSSEPFKPWLRPLVADLTDGLYFSQSTRGEIVGGISQRHVPPGINQESSHTFLGRYAQAITRTCPILGAAKVLRQWAGCYDITPDANPIVGEVDGIDHFYQASGFMGHGFMMAPIIGKLLAQYIVDDAPLPLFDRWNLRRFDRGELLSEAMIIG